MYKILAIGDSVMWGQGLNRLSRLITNLLTPSMKNYKEDWSADSRINVVHAASHVGPESFQELRELIRKASKNGQHVKAHGARHSYSDITHTSKNDGILIDMRNLNQVLTLNKAVLKSDAELGAILHFDADDDGSRRKKKQGIRLSRVGRSGHQRAGIESGTATKQAGGDVFKAIGDFLTDPIKSTIKGIENLFHFGQPGKDNDAENTSEDGKSVLAGVANCTPLWIRLMNCALKSSVTDTYRNVSHEVLYLGVNGPDGFGIEAGFEYTTMEKVDEHLSLIFQFFKEKNAHGHAATTPMGIRFVKGTKAYLSPQYGRDTVMFEIGMLAGTNQGQDMLEDLQKKLQKAGGRLHWGLHLKALDVAPDQLRRQYPMYDRWVKVYRELNSKGIFNNSFTERMELSVHPRA